MTVNPTARHRARIEAQYPGTCSCGRSFFAGVDVDWCPESKTVIGCPGCDYSGRAKADVSNINMRGVAAALRRSEEKRRKQRAKELAGAGN